MTGYLKVNEKFYFQLLKFLKAVFAWNGMLLCYVGLLGHHYICYVITNIRKYTKETQFQFSDFSPKISLLETL